MLNICGIDEAGRGCLAGPVVSAAIIINKNIIPSDIKDSKLLTPKEREDFYHYLINHSISYSIGIASNVEIDEINILNATMLSMERAFNNLSEKPAVIIIDGPFAPKKLKNIADIKVLPVIKADERVKIVSCASVVAKVTRDYIMTRYYDDRYPLYGFKNHKGYATKEHRENIKKYGFTDMHRITFSLV